MAISSQEVRLKAFEIRDQAGRQKYPATKIKVGAVLYSYSAYSFDDGSSTVDAIEWHVRSIMKRRGSQTFHGRKKAFSEYRSDKFVHITQKIKGVTWIKLSTKHFDFGFAKSISESYKDKFKVGDHLPRGVFTTRLAALKYAIKAKSESIEHSIRLQKAETDPVEIEEWQEEIDDEKKELRLLNARLTKLKKASQ